MEADNAAANLPGSINRGLDVRRTVTKKNVGWVWDSGPP
jgi:hypothetical protein